MTNLVTTPPAVAAKPAPAPARERKVNPLNGLAHIALFQGAAKWIRRVSEPSRVADYIDMAFTAATSGRPGPAVLMLPQLGAAILAFPLAARIVYSLDRWRLYR